MAGFVGHLIEFRTPDGLAIRVYTDLAGGLVSAEMNPAQADIDNPWVNPPLMARPKGDHQHGRSDDPAGGAPSCSTPRRPGRNGGRARQASCHLGCNRYRLVQPSTYDRSASRRPPRVAMPSLAYAW